MKQKQELHYYISFYFFHIYRGILHRLQILKALKSLKTLKSHFDRSKLELETCVLYGGLLSFVRLLRFVCAHVMVKEFTTCMYTQINRVLPLQSGKTASRHRLLHVFCVTLPDYTCWVERFSNSWWGTYQHQLLNYILGPFFFSYRFVKNWLKV